MTTPAPENSSSRPGDVVRWEPAPVGDAAWSERRGRIFEQHFRDLLAHAEQDRKLSALAPDLAQNALLDYCVYERNNVEGRVSPASPDEAWPGGQVPASVWPLLIKRLAWRMTDEHRSLQVRQRPDIVAKVADTAGEPTPAEVKVDLTQRWALWCEFAELHPVCAWAINARHGEGLSEAEIGRRCGLDGTKERGKVRELVDRAMLDWQVWLTERKHRRPHRPCGILRPLGSRLRAVLSELGSLFLGK